MCCSSGLVYWLANTTPCTTGKTWFRGSGNLTRVLGEVGQEAKSSAERSTQPHQSAGDNSHHFFVRLDDGKVTGWNRTCISPDQAIADLDSSVTFLRTSRGDLVIQSWNASPTTRLVAVIKITDRFPIINNYLSPQWEPSISRFAIAVFA